MRTFVVHAFVDQIKDVLFYLLWLRARCVPSVRMSITPDQPLCEVPGDIVVPNRSPCYICSVCNQTHRCCTTTLQESEDGILVFAVNFQLACEWKTGYESVSRTHILQTIHEFEVFCRFLVTKLITRETKELHVTVWFRRMVRFRVVGTILLLKVIHLAVLRGVTSEACYVDCEEDTSLVVLEVEHIVRQTVHFELEEFLRVLCV